MALTDEQLARDLLEKGAVIAWDEGLMTKEEMDRALAWLTDLLALVREIASKEPRGCDGYCSCIYCGQSRESHAPDCVWLRARALVARLDGKESA